jgi:hypothetical protein
MNNKLDPDLKRLLKWARETSPRPTELPFGFSTRVLVSRKPQRTPTLLQELQQSAWSLSLASLTLILCCGLIWISQRSAPPLTGEFSSALGFLAGNFAR